MAETRTTSEAAELLGLASAASARTTLRRLGVHPVGRQAGSAGESLYDADQIAAAVATRPGRGARTDLKTKEPTMPETYDMNTDGLADLALPADLEQRLADAPWPVRGQVEDAVNARLAESGWNGDWSAETIVRDALDTITATVNVVTGRLNITVPGATDTDIATIAGVTVPTVAELEPWGAEEEDYDRADAALTDMGWTRTGGWVVAGPDELATATVVRHP